jgi:hypothetical protein
MQSTTCEKLGSNGAIGVVWSALRELIALDIVAHFQFQESGPPCVGATRRALLQCTREAHYVKVIAEALNGSRAAIPSKGVNGKTILLGRGRNGS